MTTAAVFADDPKLNPVAMVRGLWGHRRLIRQLAARDVSSKYRGSHLGILWSLLNPLILLGIYTVVFSGIMGQKWATGRDLGMGQYSLYLLAGLVPWTFFSEVLGRAATQVTSVPNYVKRVVFPLEILTVVNIGSSLVNLGIGIGVLGVFELAVARSIPWTAIFFPFVMLPIVLFTAGISWFLGALGTYVRDIAQFIGVALMGLMFLSPLFWDVSMAPARVKPFLLMNPMAPVLQGARDTLVQGAWPHYKVLAAWTVASALCAWAGHAFFVYTKRGFADVI